MSYNTNKLMNTCTIEYETYMEYMVDEYLKVTVF